MQVFGECQGRHSQLADIVAMKARSSDRHGRSLTGGNPESVGDIEAGIAATLLEQHVDPLAQAVRRLRRALPAPERLRERVAASIAPALRSALMHAGIARTALLRGDEGGYALNMARAQVEVGWARRVIAEAIEASERGKKGGRQSEDEKAQAWLKSLEHLEKANQTKKSKPEMWQDIAAQWVADGHKPVDWKTIRNRVSEYRIKLKTAKDEPPGT